MRKLASWLLVAFLVASLPGAVKAATTIDLVFENSGTPVTSVSSNFDVNFEVTVVMNIILTSDDALTTGSVSVAWDSPVTTATAGTTEWVGVAVTFNMMTGFPTSFFRPGIVGPGGAFIDNTHNIVYSFDGVIFPPNNPPNLPAGSYQIGTIVWNTSAGVTNIVSFISPFDVFLVGTIDITETVTLGGATMNIGIPEPGTAGLLLFGVLGLTFAARSAASKGKRS